MHSYHSTNPALRIVISCEIGKSVSSVYTAVALSLIHISCALEPQDAAFAGEFFAATIVGLLERWCARGMREDAARYEDCLTRILSGEMLNTYLRSVSPESDQ